MLIHRIHKQLLSDPSYTNAVQTLEQNEDCTVSVAQSARPVLLASLWSARPKPMLVVCASENQAQQYTTLLRSWLGFEAVLLYPAREDLPWHAKAPDMDVLGKRARALEALINTEPVIVVASAQAVLRKIPPEKVAFESLVFEIGDEVAFEYVQDQLVAKGYTHTSNAKNPGEFSVHGDSIDVFATQATSPVRIEFFGDEIDRIRTVVASTGQTIKDLESTCISPARELSFTPENISRARQALYNKAQENTQISSDLELIEQASADYTLDKYLPVLYGSSASVFDFLSPEVTVVLNEPRAIFDACAHEIDDILGRATQAKESIEGLFVRPQELDFGAGQRISFVSMLLASATPTATIQTAQPQMAGNDAQYLARLRELVQKNFAVCFAVPDSGAREFIQERLFEEKIAYRQQLKQIPGSMAELWEQDTTQIERGVVTLVDLPVANGVVFPDAHIAVLSVNDLQSQKTKRFQAKKIDPTEVTFPFKPGDYVVHATHGIALFSEIVPKVVAGIRRDYFLLEYAQGDKLYVPFEQVAKLSRYVGPDSNNPRLTRLNTADWSRALTKARKSAKKLAFDLVDLYTRRSSVSGFAFRGDSLVQEMMEAGFEYDLTRDQERALSEIKADMELARPMDRLLCGDVGFGKTEVALRAAFKCVDAGKQVMVLCPTTILAEQHHSTFFERFAPFDKEVAVLSRFVTPAKQKKIIERFSQGEISVLVGTHRLLSSDINPYDLGLVIVDEEQRFGVQHKEQLKNIREQVDVLTLSATPIPRTMQMALSGVRDMSLILTPPKGRKPVEVHVGEYDPDLVFTAINRELERKGQVYYVSNQVKTIEDVKERLSELVPDARIAIAHGQMSARETEQVMVEFEHHHIDILLATTIIESGIDNPRTNTLIIEDAQRMGLAQLYQLKGRVGRGKTQAYAYFLFPAHTPLTEEATERLLAIYENQALGSGMRIAMRDLEIRGAGSLMGAEQHGNLSSVGFDLFTQMLSEAVELAQGKTEQMQETEVQINVSCPYYLDESYIPEVDKRVLVYRKLCSALDLEYVDELEAKTIQEYGELDDAAKNLFDKTRVRIRATQLGIHSISIADSRRIVLQNITVSREIAAKIKEHRGLVFLQSKKITYPIPSKEGRVMQAINNLLAMIDPGDA